MKEDNKIDLVQDMQDYIQQNGLEPNFSLDQLYKEIGYSKRHADRVFTEVLHMTPMEYVRKLILTESVKKLLEGNNNIVDIALDSNYTTHEGFTRAFKKNFSLAPEEYRKSPRAIPLLHQHPVWAYYTYQNHKERLTMDTNAMLCMVTPVKKPARRLVILRSVNAKDYWSFCEEIGCDWEGILNSIPEKLDVAAILSLPKSLVKEGTSSIAAGIEVPIDYACVIPKGYEMIDIPENLMLYFQSEPFDDEKKFGVEINCVFHAYEKYNPEQYGYRYDFDAVPTFNFGASMWMGAKLAFPIRKVEE